MYIYGDGGWVGRHYCACGAYIVAPKSAVCYVVAPCLTDSIRSGWKGWFVLHILVVHGCDCKPDIWFYAHEKIYI